MKKVGAWFWLNIILLVVIFSIWFILSESAKTFFSFLGFFALMTLVGIIVKSFSLKDKEELLFFISSSFIFGTCVYIIFFIMLKSLFVSLNIIFYLFLLLVVLAFVLKFKDVKRTKVDLSFLSSKYLSVILLLYLLVVPIIATRIVISDDGVYLKDRLHGTYEAGIARAVDNIPRQQDLSYEGKSIKYHFGAPIIIETLSEIFKIDILLVTYRILGMLIPLIFLILFYQVSVGFSKDSRASVLITALIFAGSATIFPIDLWLGAEANSLLYRATYMISYGLGICMALLLLDNYLSNKNQKLCIPILLYALVITKISFSIPFFGALFFKSLIKSIRNRTFLPLISFSIISVPLVVYFIFYMIGAHSHNLWILFLGYYKVYTQKIHGVLLYIFPFVSLVISAIITFGIGLVVVFESIKKTIKVFFESFSRKAKQKLSINNAYFFVYALISISFFMSMFIVEARENNNYQFAIPGLLAVFIIITKKIYDYRIIYSKRNFFIALTLVVFSILFNVASVFPQTEIGYKNVDTNIISYTSLYLQERFSTSVFSRMFDSTKVYNLALNKLFKSGEGSISGSLGCKSSNLDGWTFFSKDLSDGMRYLKENTPKDAVFIFGEHYQFYQNPCDWPPSSSFRTSVSARQVVAEDYIYRGIIMQKDLINRTLDILKFYRAFVDDKTINKESWDGIGKIPLREGSLSYENYFRIFKKDNSFDRDKIFREVIRAEYVNVINEKRDEEKALGFIKNIIRKYNIDYIVFEKRELPRQELLDKLGAVLFFDSNLVKIYKV